MSPDPGLASWLKRSLTPGLGASTVRNLLKQFGLHEAVLARQRAELASFLAPAALEALHSSRVRDAVERALQWAAADDHFVITLADETYPHALLEIADPPPLLYAHGRLPLLRQAALAVVGSRNASAQGESNAEHFATALSRGSGARCVRNSGLDSFAALEGLPRAHQIGREARRIGRGRARRACGVQTEWLCEHCGEYRRKCRADR